MPKALPLPHSTLIHSKDLDESRHFYSQRKVPVKAEKEKNKTPFEWRSNIGFAGPISLTVNSFQGGVRAWTESVGDFYALSFPMESGGEAVYGGTAVELVSGVTGAIASPLRAADLRMGLGYQSIEINIPRPMMEGALASLLGRHLDRPLSFVPSLSIASGAGAGALRLAQFMLSELDHGDAGLLSRSLVVTQFTDALLYHILLAQPNNYTSHLSAPPLTAEPQYISQLTEYIDAHASEPLSFSSLTKMTGMSLRSLQAGLRKHRGCSITEFLRERRLVMARAKLLSSPQATVSQIAISCGFEHLGRFSLQYRARFGESPVETLRRAHDINPR
jgi:AraC-like DNA-binding protein